MEKLSPSTMNYFAQEQTAWLWNLEFKSSSTVPYYLLNHLLYIGMSHIVVRRMDLKQDCLVLNSSLITYELWEHLPHWLSVPSSIKWG